MILVILVLAAFCFFLVAVLMAKGHARSRWLAALAAVLIASVLAIAANDVNHFGLKAVTTARTTRITGVAGNMVGIRYLGTAKQDYAVIYRQNPLSKKVTVAKPDITTRIRLKRGTRATLTTTDQELRYQNRFYAALFAWSGQNHLRLQRTYTFTIPANWALVRK